MNIQTSLTILGALVILLAVLFLLQTRGVVNIMGPNTDLSGLDNEEAVETNGEMAEYEMLSDTKSLTFNPVTPDNVGIAVVNIVDTNKGLRVEINLDSLENTGLEANITTGSCSSEGEVIHALSPLKEGNSVTFIEEAKLDELYSDQISIRINSSDNNQSKAFCTGIL